MMMSYGWPDFGGLGDDCMLVINKEVLYFAAEVDSHEAHS